MKVHQLLAATLDTIVAEIKDIQIDGTYQRIQEASAVAYDHLTYTERLDLPEGG